MDDLRGNDSDSKDVDGDKNQAERVYAELRKVEGMLASGDTTSLNSAKDIVSEIQSLLEVWKSEGYPTKQWNELAASAATAKGHLERLEYRIEESCSAYKMALGYWSGSDLDAETLAMRSANLHTYQGLAFLAGRRPEWLPRALEHFESSIRIREGVADRGESWRWAMSAALINRGDVLAGMKTIDSLQEAIRSYQKAAGWIEDFDIKANPIYRTRFALCHQNIGSARVELCGLFNAGKWGGRHDWEEAEASYDKAADTLRAGVMTGLEESRRMLAVVLTNKSRARLLLEKSSTEDSAAEAREALALIENYDASDWELLNLDLTARVSLCLALRLLNDTPDAAGEITDIVEAGLTGVKAHLNLGGDIGIIDPLIGQLFRCGAETYLRHMPQFLTDYLLDSLDPDRDSSGLDRSSSCHEAAVEVLWSGIAGLKGQGFAGFGSEEFEQKMDRQIEWDQCRERLAEIRSTRFVF